MNETQSNMPDFDGTKNELPYQVSSKENKGVQIKKEAQNNKKNKDERNKKKDDKSVDQLLKTLGNLSTSEEKLTAMCKKYAELVDENKKLVLQVKQNEKKAMSLQREKEHLQAEHSKTILTRSRLESLCRELQKQNKEIKEESLQHIKEEEEKRKTVSGKFQSTLNEITVLMQQNNENNSKLREENIEMQNKLKNVCEQYELREQQVEKMSKQMQLESQLAESKLAKLKIEMLTEKELLENEKKQLLIELAAYQHKCQEMQKTEATLNSQISLYNEKYNKFQDVLTKSNELYCGFKGEIKNMSKKISKLEKETSVWKMRWENNHKALLQMAGEKTQLTRQLTQLQKLCRTLQGDRTSLLMQLKNEGITPKLSGDYASPEPTESIGEKIDTESLPTEVDPLTNENDVIVENGEKELKENEQETITQDGCAVEGVEEEEEENIQASSVEDAMRHENEVEVNKANLNSKSKKGKESSKKRRK